MKKVENITETLKDEILEFLYKDELLNLNLIDAIENNKLGDLYIMKTNNDLCSILHSRFDGNSKFTNFSYNSDLGLNGIINQLKIINKEKVLLAGKKVDVLKVINALDGRITCGSDIYYKYNEKSSFNFCKSGLLFRKTKCCEDDREVLKDFLVKFFNAITEEEIKAITDKNLIEEDLKSETFFIEKIDKVIGMARICGETKNYSEITGVYILPEYRGLGYGKILMMNMINYIMTKNKIPVLQTAEENLVAKRTYEALGFIKVADYSFEFL